MDFLLNDMMNASFWISALQIIGVNVILSGDNAVVIALACMTLPPKQRMWGMILGAGVAVLLRVVFTLVVAQAMAYPFLKLVGGLLLFWVATKLVTEDADGDGEKVESADNLWRAVRIVAVADIVMSLDNVIAIAASAEIAAAQVDASHVAFIKATLIIFGLATSVPLIVAGSAILMALLARFRILVWAGGALLGFVAGDIMATDPAVTSWLGAETVHTIEPWAGRLGAVLVVAIGMAVVMRHRPLEREEKLAGLGLVVWILGDILIGSQIGAENAAMAWAARGVLAAALAVAYAFARETPHEKLSQHSSVPDAAE